MSGPQQPADEGNQHVRKTLGIGRQSAGFIQRGHPWVRPDRFTRGLDSLRAGDLVTLTDEQGRGLASALADPQAEICARVIAREPGASFDPGALVAKAWARRGRFHHDRSTDCYRIVHGEADGLPGLRVERYADVVVILVMETCALPYAETVAAALAQCCPNARIIIREHLDDLRREGVHTRAWQGILPTPDATVEAREFGLRLPLHPFDQLATGIYVDQRGTRRFLRKHCAGWRVCNLFAYTGIFSLSLLAAGAASALDVDLAAPALAQADATASLNGLGDRHRSIHADCLEFLASDTGSYDCIISDPPTAAQGGGQGWVSRRDYPRLLALALPRLAPQGLLLVCCNTLGAKPADPEQVLSAAEASIGIRLRRLPSPDLDPDLPQLSGFPEGRPFRLVLAQRAQP